MNGDEDVLLNMLFRVGTVTRGYSKHNSRESRGYLAHNLLFACPSRPSALLEIRDSQLIS